jgi:ABC-2 type transport system permease protein
MLTDIAIVMWKELREIVFPDGRFHGGARNIFVFAAVVGLLFPLQAGPRWFTSWMTVQAACFPVILVLNYSADAFAGERERHTLETLLASRLSDTAILLGKIAAIVVYAWSFVIACQVVAVIALNLMYRDAGFMFYRPAILLSILVISALAALLLCTIGVVLSLTAPTVRAAGQRMLVPFLAMFVLPAAAPFVIAKLHWQQPATLLTPGTIVVFVGIALALLTAIVLAVGVTRFVRERMVLA